MRGPGWKDLPAKRPDFNVIDVFLEPDGDRWRVDVIARPTNAVLGSDIFPDEDLAAARASDFARLMEKLWWEFGVRVNRHFRTPKAGL